MIMRVNRPNSVLYTWNCEEVASKLAHNASIVDNLSKYFPVLDAGGPTLTQMMDEM